VLSTHGSRRSPLLSALHEDPISDDQIELHIYACLVLAHKLHHAEPLEQVVEQTNMWIADVVQEPLEYVRRNQIRKKIIIVKNSYERMAEDSHFRDSVATDARRVARLFIQT
jgi:hypothetical protein